MGLACHFCFRGDLRSEKRVLMPPHAGGVPDHLCQTCSGVTTKDTVTVSPTIFRLVPLGTHGDVPKSAQADGFAGMIFQALCFRHSFPKPVCLSTHWWFSVFPQNKGRPVQSQAAVHLQGVKPSRHHMQDCKDEARGKASHGPVMQVTGHRKAPQPCPTYLSILGKEGRCFQNMST